MIATSKAKPARFRRKIDDGPGTLVPTGSDLRNATRAQQLAAAYGALPWGGGAAALAALLTAALLTRIQAAEPWAAFAWAAVLCACAAAHLPLSRAFATRTGPRTLAWAAALAAVLASEGALWGWASVDLVGQGRLASDMLILIVDLSVCAGAAVAFAAWPVAALCFLLPATLPYAATAPFAAYALQRAAAPLMGLFVVGLASLALAGGRRFRATITARLGAEAALREQAALMAAAGHDLRQPLLSVRLFVGALLAQGLPPAARALGERLEAAVDGLDAQFTDLLDLTRLDAGQVAPVFAPTPLGPVLAAVAATFAPQAADRGLALRVAPTSRMVVTDGRLLRRILANLVDNALSCATSGGVLIGARRAGGETRIEVWDTGPGVAQGDWERIFEPYVRLRSTAGGLGLGLAIVRRTTDLLGARVTVRRSSPRGSCFSVTLSAATRPTSG